MEKARSSPSRFVPTAQLMPPSNTTRAMTFAGVAALAGAAVWGLLVYTAHIESGWLAWGIGAAVGFAATKAGGHGSPVALGAAVLTLLAIGSGKHLAFRLFVDREASAFADGAEAHHHAERTRDAADWVALGPAPTEEQITTFLAEHGYEPRPSAVFADGEGKALAAFAAAKPSLEQWRDELRAEFVAGTSFTDYLRADFHPADIVFVLLGLATAFGFVSKYTTDLAVRVREAERQRRETEAGSASATTSDAAD